MRILLLAFAFKSEYHVLRCLSQNGAEVHILGINLAKGLSSSRYCSSYHELHYNPLFMPLNKVIEEINSFTENLKIDYVVPSDIISTKLMISIKDSLSSKTPLLPDMDSFNKLNNKWSFYEFCKSINIPTPRTYSFSTISDLRSAFNRRELSLPLIIKPTDRMGGSDIHILKNEADFKKLINLDYQPILAQEYISGRDCGVSMVCKNGVIISASFQRHFNWGYEFDNKESLTKYLSIIAQKINFSGIAHFDLLEIEEDKTFTFIECNPRSWYSIDYLMLAGLNYPLLSLDDYDYSDHNKVYLDKKVSLKVNKSLFKSLLNPQKYNKTDINTFIYYLSDPVPYISERFAIYDDQKISGPGSLVDQIEYFHAIP
jgi:hypothetical protein